MATQTQTQLSHSQRTRLIRSTRKLGALLGTTPQVIELTDDNTPLNTPRSSFDKSCRPRSGGQSLPPPLVLRLQSVPRDSKPSQPSSSSAITLQVPRSPMSPTFDSLNRDSPPSPSSITYTGHYDIRRKKMAKLTRTLGENIPPELVFQAPSRSAKRLSRSYSVEDLKTPTLSSYDFPLPPNTHAKSEPVEVDFVVRVSSSSDDSASGSWKPQIQPRSSSLRLRSRTQSRRDDRDRSSAYEVGRRHGLGHGYTPSESQTPFLKSSSSSSTTSWDSCESLESDPNAYGRKKEREWSGEWNQKDMGDVLRKLRNLK
ncbi:hypothetical protein VNI00_006644 [Paramarasmius palmivorus]|uniref:Uncharacterized protein n=1 Tax=Paramarasmius palmivorus TaxID=297713 RepID=A0AAW0D8K3_9AGAR